MKTYMNIYTGSVDTQDNWESDGFPITTEGLVEVRLPFNDKEKEESSWVEV